MKTAELLRGAFADRYTIEREIGRGGMATVYLANDTKHGRTVAIKVLRPELAASLGADRFLREIGIAARLSHPHIVPLIDSGEARGMLYYVAAYIAGGSLRDRLEHDGRLPIRDALRIAREVGSALDYAHRNGVVHRDVKPANILFADGLALLADFGVAHACPPPGTDALTAGGVVLGTPAYMSPEQASGETDVGSQSDVYSLACVVFEMLTGEPPFQSDTARATMAKHVTELPRLLRTLRPDARVTIERAVATALAKDPAHRFASVADFVTALEAEGPARGHRSPARTRSIAVLPFVNASSDPENEYLSDGITDELIDALAKVDGLRIASRTSVFALKGKPQDVRAIGVLLGASEVLEGSVRKVRNRLRITAQLTSTDDGRLLWSQRYDRTLDDVFAMQDEIARTIVTTLRATTFADVAEPPPQRHTEHVKAYGLYLRGRYAWNKRTQEGVSEAIRYFEQAIAEDPTYAAAYTGLADSYVLHVDYRSTPVAEGFARAKAYARTAIALQDTLADAHASLAWTLFIYDWDWEEAGREFRRAIELDPRYASTHQWYAFLLIAHGHLDEALVEGHTALELDPGSVSIRRSLGLLYYYARRFDQAEYHLMRAITANPTAEETHRLLGLTLAQAGRFDEAERALGEALELPGSGTYSLATLGYVLARAGDRDRATTILRELETRSTHDYVSPVAFATVYLGLGEWDQALTHAERAYDERRGWLVYLRVNPMLDPVRGDPRFETLVRRMRL